MIRHLRRLSLLLTAATALLVPNVASASARHSHVRCRAGYHQKTTHARHKRHLVCVKNKVTKSKTTTPSSQMPTTPPPAPASTTTTPVTAGTTAPPVTCDGALSAWDFISATGTNHEAGFIDMSPAATPGSAFSSQWVAAREWMYSYSLGRWMTITNWQEEVVSQPDPNVVTVGDTSGSPFRFNGLLGNYGWVYIDTEYWWWTGSQWTGGTYVPTINYTQSYSVTSRTTGSTWGYLS